MKMTTGQIIGAGVGITSVLIALAGLILTLVAMNRANVTARAESAREMGALIAEVGALAQQVNRQADEIAAQRKEIAAVNGHLVGYQQLLQARGR